METEININNLRTFVEALNKLPREVKNNEVDMTSAAEPVCGTAGCPAGLVSIVADYIPELKSLYFDDYNCDYKYKYDHSRWAHTLAEFLGFTSSLGLKDWAHNNPELWGNYYGFGVFDDGEAFGEESNVFPLSVIIDRWSVVLERVELERVEQLNDK